MTSPRVGSECRGGGGETLLQKRVSPSLAKNGCDEDGSLPSGFRDASNSGARLTKTELYREGSIVDDMAGAAIADSEFVDLQISNSRGQPFRKGVLPSGIRAFNKVLSGTGAEKVVSRAIFLDLVPTVFVEVWIGLISGNVDTANKDPTPSTGSSGMFTRRSTSRSPDPI